MAVADEDLAAVEDVVVAVPYRAALHAGYVSPRPRLGDRDGRQYLSPGDFRQPVALLAVVAEVNDLGDAQLGGLDHGPHRAAHPGQFLDDDGLGEMARAHTAVGRVDRGADPALLGDQPGEPHQRGTEASISGISGRTTRSANSRTRCRRSSWSCVVKTCSTPSPSRVSPRRKARWLYVRLWFQGGPGRRATWSTNQPLTPRSFKWFGRNVGC